MSTTAVAEPTLVRRSWAHATRSILVALSVVVLVAVAFLAGRASAGTSSGAPGPARSSPAAPTAETICHVGQPC